MQNHTGPSRWSYSGLEDPQFDSVERALVISAHPDDLDFGAAGTIALLRARGVQVHYAIVTDGDAGGFDASTHATIVEQRHREQRAAAAQVGVSQVHFLGYPDGALAVTDEVVRDIVRLIRQVRADVVITMHPERNWNHIQASHPDHLATGEASVRAVYPAAENQFAFPELLEEGLPAHKVRWLWMYAAPDNLVNMAVDVEGSLEQKMAALAQHRSQHPNPQAMREGVLAMLAQNAKDVGKDGYAELFQVVQVNAAHTFAGF